VKAKSAAEAQLKPPTGILITGVPGHYIENLTLQDIEISLPGGGTVKDADHSVPEAETAYPEVSTFGPTIPAYGIWARHVKGLTLDHITLRLDSADLRPAFFVQDGGEITIINSTVPFAKGAASVVFLENVAGAMVNKNHIIGNDTESVKVKDKNSSNVVVENNKTCASTTKRKPFQKLKTNKKQSN
jgi:hypothetical protein